MNLLFQWNYFLGVDYFATVASKSVWVWAKCQHTKKIVLWRTFFCNILSPMGVAFSAKFCRWDSIALLTKDSLLGAILWSLHKTQATLKRVDIIKRMKAGCYWCSRFSYIYNGDLNWLRLQTFILLVLKLYQLRVELKIQWIKWQRQGFFFSQNPGLNIHTRI